jgi:hypothetical protein
MTLAPARKAMLTGGASGFGRDEASSLTGVPPDVERRRAPRLLPGCVAMRIEHCELTFLNLPMVQPELWAWGRRDGYTSGSSGCTRTPGLRESARSTSAWARMTA